MNGLLQGLRDIHMAPPAGVWPPAIGWWLLALLLAALLLWLARIVHRYYRRWRKRRIALHALQKARTVSGNDSRALAAELSMVLRRVALTQYPREEIASLSGQHWLAFLDRTGGDGAFRDGIGQVLADAPYRPHVQVEQERLYRLAEDWIIKNA